ncbi:uncharacterized protein C12orf76 homolog [Varanus komodoensis]|uniref:uncharacterized protein C12orf76 homolog n=1 Tax=Varanus komodoensis TaxID=61221 RepID=UPI001CF7EB80|nr:uncharacterized protein C12orf76 homolog [Varanus komodoensis]
MRLVVKKPSRKCVQPKWDYEAAAAAAGEEPGRAAPAAHSRPYAVLKTQNLALMGSVFGVLLVAMILMAVCIYKPVRRR